MTWRAVSLLVATSITLSSLQACRGEDFPGADHMEILNENILTTDYSGVVEIVHSRMLQQAALVGDGVQSDVIEVVYTARVLETFYGKSENEIKFSRYQQKDEKLAEDGRKLLIISLCLDHDGGLYLPDVGYEFPVDELLVDAARAINQNQERGISVCQ